MKNRFKTGAQFLCLDSVNQPALRSAFLTTLVLLTKLVGEGESDLVRVVRFVRLSPTQSNLVKPNPTTRLPLGKENGKETVKFLAFFDHMSIMPTFLPSPLFHQTKPPTSFGARFRFSPFNSFNLFYPFNFLCYLL
jgi:hypothetical protein